MINAPVLHVNGDHPEGMREIFSWSSSDESSADVSRALDTAFQYRNTFRKDIIVDLLVYRRWCVKTCFRASGAMILTLASQRGHNELDEPAFTQPLMYQNIRTRNSVPELYEDKLMVRFKEFLLIITCSISVFVFKE